MLMVLLLHTAHIADSQVTADKLTQLVTDGKLASNSVTTSKITDANVTTVKIATATTLANGAVSKTDYSYR